MSLKRILSFVGIVAGSLFSSVLNGQSVKTFSVTNPNNFSRESELIVLKRTELEKKLGKIPKYIEVKQGLAIQYLQFDDLNSDGKWDEAVYLYSFQARQKVTFSVLLKDAVTQSFVQKAHVRLKKKNPDGSWGPLVAKEQMPLQNPATDFSKQPLPLYLTEGPASENDKVGFRLYFDVRNGKDIWGKRTSRMVLDSIGTKVEPSYHDLNDWGMDVLHVGKSLGSGALALLIPESDGRDTLLRIGGSAVVKTTYTQIADGPVRAIFEMNYELDINHQAIRVLEQTSIWGGQFFYQSKVSITGAPAGTKLVTGIANFYDNVFRTFNSGSCDVLLSHGRQSENKDYLGMAVLVPDSNASFLGSSPNANSEILNSYLAILKIDKAKPSLFRFYAAWEKTNPRFASINFFSDMLHSECQKVDHPLQIIF